MTFSEFKKSEIYKNSKLVEVYLLKDKKVGYEYVGNGKEEFLNGMFVEHYNTHPNGMIQISLITEKR